METMKSLNELLVKSHTSLSTLPSNESSLSDDRDSLLTEQSSDTTPADDPHYSKKLLIHYKGYKINLSGCLLQLLNPV